MKAKQSELEAALLETMSNHLIRARMIVSEAEAVRFLAWRFGLQAAAIYSGDALDLARAKIKGAA